ncbi:MAG: tetratricopeptide repeat protein [Halieaceae bacterium]|jgi:TPR repeat protein|nr:tetratricopeptide repeat protein [Halieaceae bacterium]
MPQCPSCDSTQVRKSRKQKTPDKDHRPFIAAFRCDECGKRFVARDVAAIAWRGLGGAAVVALLLSIIVLVDHPTPEAPVSEETTQPEAGSARITTALADYATTDDVRALTRSAELGDTQSQFQLAMALYRDFQRTDDLTAQYEALRWLRQSAESGHPRAQTELGLRYLSGEGVVQDFEQAADWFRRAAEQGSPEAMYGLGNMARFGRAPDVDLVEAYAWLNVASARGERRAADARRDVMDRLTVDDLKRAQQLSRQLDQQIGLPPTS